MTIETQPSPDFLSELYAQDAPEACLLAEYPSSNSDDTLFQNKTKYIIHDPFPPPRRELLKILGPHHLMCGWGQHIDVTSEIAPPPLLLDHWKNVFGPEGVPRWRPFDTDATFITLFPHQSLAPEQQVVDPDANYAVHSKLVIEKIDCPQAEVLGAVTPPCIVKLSHGYAGLGNFLIQSESDEAKMRKELQMHWPDSELVANSIIENIVGDYGVQFYLRKDGSMIWLGFTEQHFDSTKKWCGGSFSADLQNELIDDVCMIVEPVGGHLHDCGYFGLVGIDILRDQSNRMFLVDVNPRLTGISPFLMASRVFARDGLKQGIYQASCRFSGTFEQLVNTAESINGARVLVLSAFEDATRGETSTICHLSVTSESQDCNQQVLQQILKS